ncbi:MAG TPA: flagellin [Bryobacteraceae bacterium]|nr:flagellin [Bryobacteraceae bacterium]
MSFSIQTNVSSLIAQENFRVNSEFQGRTISRLTSGFRINLSGDDAAGLSVANKFRSEIAELYQGVRNTNDGISTLQIVDGGLNNISKMLDRLKTLATQSASGTFSGDRSILNTEYQALLSEIDRQAGNIGLSSGSHGGRYNTDISVFVGGGGSTGAGSRITINLSGTANRVDSSGLALSGTSIAGGAATSMGSKSISSGSFLTSATQNFTFNISKAGQAAFTTTVAVTGGAAGITGTEAVAQLNSALNSQGISASINSSTGALQFSGDVAFTATSTAGATGITTTGASSIENGSLYRVGTGAQDAWINPTADHTFTFGSGSSSVAVTVATGTTIDNALTQLNAAIRPLGIYAVKDSDGDNIEFQSSTTFSLTTAGTATDGAFATAGAKTVTAPTTTGSATSAADAALTALTSAVSNLGAVQGKVGTAQNKLAYAVQLAQSQISNFSAAESRIRDADVAMEAANLTKAQVLQQASLAAMAQANSAPQALLALLRG